jgi:hypothetical protein
MREDQIKIILQVPVQVQLRRVLFKLHACSLVDMFRDLFMQPGFKYG